eukprot:313640-Rhodomonas_salina.3
MATKTNNTLYSGWDVHAEYAPAASGPDAPHASPHAAPRGAAPVQSGGATMEQKRNLDQKWPWQLYPVGPPRNHYWSLVYRMPTQEYANGPKAPAPPYYTNGPKPSSSKSPRLCTQCH